MVIVLSLLFRHAHGVHAVVGAAGFLVPVLGQHRPGGIAHEGDLPCGEALFVEGEITLQRDKIGVHPGHIFSYALILFQPFGEDGLFIRIEDVYIAGAGDLDGEAGLVFGDHFVAAAGHDVGAAGEVFRDVGELIEAVHVLVVTGVEFSDLVGTAGSGVNDGNHREFLLSG